MEWETKDWMNYAFFFHMVICLWKCVYIQKDVCIPQPELFVQIIIVQEIGQFALVDSVGRLNIGQSLLFYCQ